MPDELDLIHQEITKTGPDLDPEDFSRVARDLDRAEQIVVAGRGRSGQVAGMFAQRLNHLGKDAWWQRDLSRPPLSPSDQFVVCSGSGATKSLISVAEIATNQEVPVLALTGNPESRLAERADTVLVIPGNRPAPEGGTSTDSPSAQPARTLFEQNLLLTTDALVLRLMKRRDLDLADLEQRHIDLE